MQTSQSRPHISVIVITYNEAHNIEACLQSVAWADEIVVVDSGSSDGTVELARKFTDRVFHNPWPGFSRQKEFALQQAAGPWVLSLDADERVTEALRDEILSLFADGEPECAGYFVPRLSTFLGKFIYHGGWYPGYQMRLFRKEKTRVRHASVHEGFEVDGPTARLHNHLLHFTHRNLYESFERLNRYSSLEAQDRAGRKRVHWWDILLHPLAAFFNKFIGLRGYRDGMHGFLLALISAMVKAALYMKIWEIQNRGKGEPNEPAA